VGDLPAGGVFWWGWLAWDQDKSDGWVSEDEIRKMRKIGSELSPVRSSEESGGTVAEARTGKRFPLELPIKIHEENASGDTKGLTGNLSAAGVYIRADAAMEIGSPVEFEITLPPDVTGGQENVTIQCKGRVVRSDPTGSSPDGKGVACVIDSYEFVRK
jgi:hypothetical protein